MAKICPITNSYVLYIDCLECDEKICRDAALKTNPEPKKTINKKNKEK